MKEVFKTFLSNLKAQFEGENFGSVVVADDEGTELFWEGDGELESGVALYILDAEGNQMPAPEGEHTLEDGRVITVDASGVISAIVEAEMKDDDKEEEEEEMAEEDKPEPKEDDKEEEMSSEGEEFAKQIKEDTDKILKSFAALTKDNKEQAKKLDEAFAMIEELKAEIKEIGEAPAAEPEKTEFKHVGRKANPVQVSLLNKTNKQ